MPTRIQYLGDKEVQTDTLFGTGAIWRGKGDIQLVGDDIKAAKMVACCPLTYRNLTEGETVRKERNAIADARKELKGSGVLVYEPSLDREIPIEEASRVAMEAKAEKMGMQIADVMSRDQIMVAILDLTDALKNPDIRSAEQIDVDPYAYHEEATRALADWLMETGIDEFQKLPKTTELKKNPPPGMHKDHLTSAVRKDAWSLVKERLKEADKAKENEPEIADEPPELDF